MPFLWCQRLRCTYFNFWLHALHSSSPDSWCAKYVWTVLCAHDNLCLSGIWRKFVAMAVSLQRVRCIVGRRFYRAMNLYSVTKQLGAYGSLVRFHKVLHIFHTTKVCHYCDIQMAADVSHTLWPHIQYIVSLKGLLLPFSPTLVWRYYGDSHHPPQPLPDCEGFCGHVKANGFSCVCCVDVDLMVICHTFGAHPAYWVVEYENVLWGRVE